MSRFTIIFHMACVALFTLVIVAEETLVNNKKKNETNNDKSEHNDIHNNINFMNYTGKGNPLSFSVEVNKMLSILIHSLYQNPNIFLRELISNGSDALDKIKFIYLTKSSSTAASPKGKKNSYINTKASKKGKGANGFDFNSHPTNQWGVEPKMDMRIRIDHYHKTLIVTDGGVGMTKEDLAEHLGKLGASGTMAFLEKFEKMQMEEKKQTKGIRKTQTNTRTGIDLNKFIGQFGVGFYSSFLVADKVVVASKHESSDKQYIWESSGEDGMYYLYEDSRGNTLGRGTEITLYLTEEAQSTLLNYKNLKDIIHKYSEFVHYPIYLSENFNESSSGNGDTIDNYSGVVGENGDEIEENATNKISTEKTHAFPDSKWELININPPLWTRNPANITKAEYHAFYKSFTNNKEKNFLYYTHFSVEGRGVEFKSILFIPSKNPSLSLPAYESAEDGHYNIGAKRSNVQLYVRRVFVTDFFQDLLPRYLFFIKGIVDSDDLPLNISREFLQESRLLHVIKRQLLKKVLGMLEAMVQRDEEIKQQQREEKISGGKKVQSNEKWNTKNKKEKNLDETGKKSTHITNENEEELIYPRFWKTYGKYLRLGIIDDTNNRARLTNLLRYQSSQSNGTYISFKEYLSRKKEKQITIYYISGESVERIKQSPVLEPFLKKGIEVLYMVDTIDEYCLSFITEHKLVNIAKENVRPAEEMKDEKNQNIPKFKKENDFSKKNAEKERKYPYLKETNTTFTKEEKQEIEAKREEKYAPLVRWLWNTLEDTKRVSKIIITKRITSEPMIVSSGSNRPSPYMVNLMKIRHQEISRSSIKTDNTLDASSSSSDSDTEYGLPIIDKRILELNPLHPVIEELWHRVQTGNSDDEMLVKNVAHVLFDTASMQNGYSISNAKDYGERVNHLLRKSLDSSVSGGGGLMTDEEEVEDLVRYEEAEEDKKEENMREEL